MSHELPFPPPGFEKLSIAEQVDYVDALWSLISVRPDVTEVPQWHLDIIAERLAKYRAGDPGWKTWDEFEAELDEELSRL